MTPSSTEEPRATTMLDDDVLREHLSTRGAFKSREWVESLDARKREEAEFHNFEREGRNQEVIEAQQASGVHANKKYYSVTSTSVAYVEQWLRQHARGKVFLDYACGNGKYAIAAAKAGASQSIGLDISDVSISNARQAAIAAQVDSVCAFIQGDCESTELPDASIDVILCSGMLHHLDLPKAYAELRRILRPGGRILGVEALGHNPVIQWYRDLTPHLRTDWEKRHILRWRDVRLADRWFTRGDVRFWHLFGVAAVPLRRTPLFGPVLGLLNAIDRAVLSIPWIQLLAWQVTFELRRPATGSDQGTLL